jgi:hypothetical protein
MNLKKNADSIVCANAINRHKYNEGIAGLCVSLVCVCGLGLGSAIKVMRFLNGRFDSLQTSSSDWWCSGFYPGTLFYLYEETGNPELLTEGNRMLSLLVKRTFFSPVIARVYPKQSIKEHGNWIASPQAVRNDGRN